MLIYVNLSKIIGIFLEIIKDVIKNWSLDYKENYVDILNNTEYVNPYIKSFALLPTYPTKYMHKAWESKTKTLRDIVVYHKRYLQDMRKSYYAAHARQP